MDRLEELRKEFPYTTTFASSVQCLVGEESDKTLALASAESLNDIIPKELNLDDNIDLLPIAFNAAIANRANLWGDIIGTETSLAIAPKFVNKLVDVEHNRALIVGHVVNAAFSKFRSPNNFTGKIIKAEDLKESQDPFNISLAAVIYKIISKDLVEELIDSSDPSSNNYLSVCASWELGFKEHILAVGSKDLKDCELITDPDLIKKWTPRLVSKKGPGRLEDGRIVNRVLTGEVMAFGVGLTLSPAAEVKGIVVKSKFIGKHQPAAKASTNPIEKEKTSQIVDSNVKDNSMSKIQITSLKDLEALKEEDLPQVALASLRTTLDGAIKEADQKWQKQLADEQKAKDDAIAEVKAAKDEASTATKKVTDLEEKLENSNKVMKELSDKEEARAAAELLQTRLSTLNASYTLSADEVKVVGQQIASLDEDGFTKWLADFSVLNASKKKEEIDTAKASKPEPTSEEKERAAQEALAAAKKKDADLPNTSVAVASGFEKYRDAFAEDGLTVSFNRK